MSVVIPVLLTICVLPVTEVGASGQEHPPIQTEVVHLSDKAIVVRVQVPRATNVIALEPEDGIILIDTEVSPVLARAVRRRIEETFHRSDFAYVVNTHHHGDHTYGNQVFDDAVIIGHEGVPAGIRDAEGGREQTKQEIAATLPSLHQALAATDPGTQQYGELAGAVDYYEAVLSGLSEGFRLTLPTLTFQDRMMVRVGDLTLEFSNFGTAHSEVS